MKTLREYTVSETCTAPNYLPTVNNPSGEYASRIWSGLAYSEAEALEFAKRNPRKTQGLPGEVRSGVVTVTSRPA